jgi:hypothetical protein
LDYYFRGEKELAEDMGDGRRLKRFLPSLFSNTVLCRASSVQTRLLSFMMVASGYQHIDESSRMHESSVSQTDIAEHSESKSAVSDVIVCRNDSTASMIGPKANATTWSSSSPKNSNLNAIK